MKNTTGFSTGNESSLWIQSHVHGLSGMSIKVKTTVFCNASPFQKIEIFDTYRFGLVLCLGGIIVLTERDSDYYHEMMVHPPMLMHKGPERVCIIGGGDGGCLREVLRYDHVKSVVIVEIDRMVREAVEQYFPSLAGAFKDPRLEIVYDDGSHYLKSAQNKFDLILADSYDPGGPVQSLESADFYQYVAEHLTDDGLAVFQTDSPVLRKEFIRQTISTVAPLFKQYKPYICTMQSFPESICSFLACARKSGGLDKFDHARFKKIEKRCTYYNADVHTGAFLLPQWIKQIYK